MFCSKVMRSRHVATYAAHCDLSGGLGSLRWRGGCRCGACTADLAALLMPWTVALPTLNWSAIFVSDWPRPAPRTWPGRAPWSWSAGQAPCLRTSRAPSLTACVQRPGPLYVGHPAEQAQGTGRGLSCWAGRRHITANCPWLTCEALSDSPARRRLRLRYPVVMWCDNDELAGLSAMQSELAALSRFDRTTSHVGLVRDGLGGAWLPSLT